MIANKSDILVNWFNKLLDMCKEESVNFLVINIILQSLVWYTILFLGVYIVKPWLDPFMICCEIWSNCGELSLHAVTMSFQFWQNKWQFCLQLHNADINAFSINDSIVAFHNNNVAPLFFLELACWYNNHNGNQCIAWEIASLSTSKADAT